MKKQAYFVYEPVFTRLPQSNTERQAYHAVAMNARQQLAASTPEAAIAEAKSLGIKLPIVGLDEVRP